MSVSGWVALFAVKAIVGLVIGVSVGYFGSRWSRMRRVVLDTHAKCPLCGQPAVTAYEDGAHLCSQGHLWRP